MCSSCYAHSSSHGMTWPLPREEAKAHTRLGETPPSSLGWLQEP